MCEPVRQGGAELSFVVSSERDENWDEITTELKEAWFGLKFTGSKNDL